MVYIHLATGFEEIEAVTIGDILRRGNVPVQYISLTGSQLVSGSHGIALQAELTWESADYENCSMIALPGGMPGTRHLAEHQGLLERIREFHSQGKWVTALCAAPLVLAEAGILKGKKATIYPGMEEELGDALVREERVVRDGHIITSRGPGTAMEFALALLEAMADPETSQRVRSGLVMA